MKLRYYHDEKPIETYYTETISDFASNPPNSLIVQQATMMVDFIRACENQEIGFDKSVGTSHSTLIFLSRAPHIKGSVTVSAWDGMYTITCGSRTVDAFWKGVQHIEGQANTLDSAIKLIRAAFDYTFIKLTAQQLRKEMLEWSTEANRQDETEPEIPYPRRAIQKFLQTVSWQGESVQTYFHRRTRDQNQFIVTKSEKMIECIAFIESHEVLLPVFVFAEEDSLVFTQSDNKTDGVRLSAELSVYSISHSLPPQLAPGPDANIKSITSKVENAAYVLENASRYYFPMMRKKED